MRHQDLDQPTSSPAFSLDRTNDTQRSAPGESLITSLAHADFQGAWNTVKNQVESWGAASPLAADDGSITIHSVWDSRHLGLLQSPPEAHKAGPLDSPPGTPLPGDFVLQGLDDKIIGKAQANVEKSMSPQEREQLNKDSAQYQEAMVEYFRRHAMFIGLNPPPEPPKPENLRRYDEAVDKEIATMTKSLEASI